MESTPCNRFDAPACSIAPHLPRPSSAGLGLRGPGVARCDSRRSSGPASAEGRPLARRRQPAARRPPKAKRVIFLYMAGGPSHLETFDYKPKLAEMHGQPMPESFTKGQPIAQLQGQKLNCFAPQHPFQKFGKSGQEICELFPHIGTVADDICIVRSMHTEAINHDPAHTFMNTGTTISGRPAMGSWVCVRPGQRERRPARLRRADLAPARAASSSRSPPGSGTAASCPAGSRASQFRSQGRPGALPQQPRRASTPAQQRDVVDAVQQLNRLQNERRRRSGDRHAHQPVRDGVPMQTSVPELMDISRRAAARARPVRHARRATARSPPTACWPAGWPSAACGSSSSTTATGTITATSRTTSTASAEEVDQAVPRR